MSGALPIIPPIAFRWSGEAFEPSTPYQARLADRHLVGGQVYLLVEHEERSMNQHRWYFAAIREAWQSLPEEMSKRLPSPEHLRRYALIKAGFADSRSIVASSRLEAQKLAAFMRPLDEFSVVDGSGSTVIHSTARSQSHRAMDKHEFRRSIEAVLDVVAGMLGTTRQDLMDAGERPAA